MSVVLALVTLAMRAGEPAPARLVPPPTVHESAAAAALRRGEQIDLNTASAADLELLPHIGPALAARIVADRLENGDFGHVEELDRVSGIGPRTLTRVAPMLRVAPRH